MGRWCGNLDAAELSQEALQSHLHARQVARTERDNKAEAEVAFRACQAAYATLDCPTAI